jgi:hypothetical protein
VLFWRDEVAMQVLLLSMPDAFEHMPAVAVRMPNGALASLAANVEPHHRVAVADLILARTAVRSTVERLVRDTAPAVVGLSVMTFQRKTALQIAALVKQQSPDTRIVVGGYDPTPCARRLCRRHRNRLHRQRRGRAYVSRPVAGVGARQPGRYDSRPFVPQRIKLRP